METSTSVSTSSTVTSSASTPGPSSTQDVCQLQRPMVMHQYNQFMGAVDKNDQMVNIIIYFQKNEVR